MKKFIKRPITAASHRDDLSTRAERIADELSEFLKDVTIQLSQGDYFDEYDMGDLGRSMDALYDFAQAYNHGKTSADVD